MERITVNEFAAKIKQVKRNEEVKEIIQSFMIGESNRDETIAKANELLANEHPILADVFRQIMEYTSPYSSVSFLYIMYMWCVVMMSCNLCRSSLQKRKEPAAVATNMIRHFQHKSNETVFSCCFYCMFILYVSN